ncbi:MAG: SDR family oxidoreductase [Flavobacteriales bacterium]|nr:SDR family oxidoreductase [Flavobacteriales bacterium]
MQKSIVFGANGYLGRHLVYFLEKNEHQVVASGNSTKSIDGLANYIKADVSNQLEVEAIDFNVDNIFVFAGLTGTSVAFNEPSKFIDANEKGLLNILNHHRNTNSKARIIFPSTRLVYKGVENVFLNEEAEKEALTIYAQNKLSCESYLAMYASNFNINYTVFRICVPYGNIFSDDYSYGTIGFFLNKAKNKQNITLYGKGEVKRTFSHVEDICEIIIKTLNNKKLKNNTYNIGSTDNLSLFEVAKLVSLKYNVGIDFVEWPKAALKIESGDTIFNDEKIQKEIHYNYKNNLVSWLNNI